MTWEIKGFIFPVFGQLAVFGILLRDHLKLGASYEKRIIAPMFFDKCVYNRLIYELTWSILATG